MIYIYIYIKFLNNIMKIMILKLIRELNGKAQSEFTHLHSMQYIEYIITKHEMYMFYLM